MPRIYKVFERQVWCVQVVHLRSAARASPSFQILSVKTSQSARENLDTYCKKVFRSATGQVFENLYLYWEKVSQSAIPEFAKLGKISGWKGIGQK